MSINGRIAALAKYGLLQICYRQNSVVCLLDRRHTCNFIARFCRATLSRDKIASVTWRVAQLLNSRTTFFRVEQRSILCNSVAKMW